MTEQEWLVSTDPAAMLIFLDTLKSSIRPARIIWPYTPSDRKLRLFVETCRERSRPNDRAWGNYDLETPSGLRGALSRWCRAYLSVLPVNPLPERAVLLRDIFGNPWRQPRRDSFVAYWLCWNGKTVLNVAQQIYDSRNFAGMPILADALEEAGCTNAEILAHGRSSELHVRGCWLIDLLLGKD